MKTYSNDHRLPSLPVPELKGTCEAALTLIAPLVDEQSFEASRAAFGEFSRPGGAGERLQQLLLEHKASMRGNASWLRPFWDDAYCAWREPLPINMNYCFRFDSERWGKDMALPRLVKALTEKAMLLRDGELPPEENRAGFLSMDQALSCFYTRIPSAGSDVLLPTVLAGPLSCAVVCQGHWFIVPLTHADGTAADENQLAQAFADIRREAEKGPAGPPVAAMTAAPRAQAATLRSALLEHLQNRLSLAEIEKSLFVLCLDAAHDSDDAFMHSLLCGPAGSRYFDASLQIISSANGGLGANFEHAGCDAAIWLYLLSLCDKAICSQPNSPDAVSAPLAFVPLKFVVDPELAGHFERAQSDFAARANAVDLQCREFIDYSREGLKSLGTSPDAFLQIGFQAAQYEIFGRVRSSYEAVAVRGFAGGRTECARGCTAQAATFAGALHSGADAETLLPAYRSAESAHKAQLARCQKGLGVERHMTGLAYMHSLHASSLGELPGVFRDPGWLTVKHDALSTSGIGAPFIRFFGFGPVVQDGYGIGYAPGPDATGLVVTSIKNKAKASSSFLEAFDQAAQKAANVLRSERREG